MHTALISVVVLSVVAICVMVVYFMDDLLGPGGAA